MGEQLTLMRNNLYGISLKHQTTMHLTSLLVVCEEYFPGVPPVMLQKAISQEASKKQILRSQKES